MAGGLGQTRDDRRVQREGLVYTPRDAIIADGPPLKPFYRG